MGHDFEAIYRNGVKHQAADALPRRLRNKTDDKDIDDEITVLAIQQQPCK